MARKPNVAVAPRSGGWVVQTAGTKRAESLHETKEQAIARGRQLATEKRTDLVIKNQSGRIVTKSSSFTTKKSTEVIRGNSQTYSDGLKRLAKR